MSGPGAWLPPGFSPPGPTTVPYGHRLRPVARGDLARLLVADAGLDPGSGAETLAGWLAERSAGVAYTYVLVDSDETAILGTVRVDPRGTTWDVVSECRGTDLALAFGDAVVRWRAAHWPAVDDATPGSGTHLA